VRFVPLISGALPDEISADQPTSRKRARS
jgi:hypothetical protein